MYIQNQRDFDRLKHLFLFYYPDSDCEPIDTLNCLVNMDINEDIRNSVEVLRAGGTLLYPTDTVWGIGCDATNYQAVDKIYKIKRRFESKSLIVLLEKFDSLSTYIRKIPDITYDLLDSIISQFGRPIVSTSANISGENTPTVFNHISEEIKNQVDYVVQFKQNIYTLAKPSTIIRLYENGNYNIIRY